MGQSAVRNRTYRGYESPIQALKTSYFLCQAHVIISYAHVIISYGGVFYLANSYTSQIIPSKLLVYPPTSIRIIVS